MIKRFCGGLVLGGAWLLLAWGAETADLQGAPGVASLVTAGQYADAEAILKDRLARDPADVEAHYYSGMIPGLTENAARYDEGIAHLERCVELRPTVSNYHLWLARLNGLKARDGGVFSALGCVRTAKAAYLKALELDPRNNEARHDLLQFYLQAPGLVGGSVARARALAAEGQRYDADMASALRADVHLHEREYAEAGQALATIGTAASAATLSYARSLARDLERALRDAGQPDRAQQVAAMAAAWPH